jgi:hypothetical protein
MVRPAAWQHSRRGGHGGLSVKSKTKIWLGVGAFMVAGASVTGGAIAEGPALTRARTGETVSDLALTRALASSTDLSAATKHSHGGEGGEGGERGGKAAKLPPDLDFALKIAQIRGHLLVGDELVKEGQWAAGLPHFLHPSEELYGPIRGRLKTYNTPPFADALKALATTVKQKKGGDDYAKALKAVEDTLAAADAGIKAKQGSEGFTVDTALELLKSATNEYEQAIVKGRIAKPVEYQDARGFVWQSEKMIEALSPALEKKDAAALKAVREGYAELKKAWPAAMPPKSPVKDHAAMLSDVSRIELAVGKLM